MNLKMKAKHMKKIKISTGRLIFYIVSAAVITVAIIFAVVIYGAWRNPAGVFLKEALSSSSNAGADIQAEAAPPQTDDEDAGNTGSEAVMADNMDLSEFSNENILNILLLGIDSDASREAKEMGWRSDMVMLCTLDIKNNTVSLTSIPRDTQTNVFHVDENGQTTKEELTKINHAYSYGGGPDKYGAQNAMAAVKDFLSSSAGFSIPIQYYISIDLENVPKLADAFGGVPVQLDVDFPELGKKGETVVIDSSNVHLFLQNRYDVGGDIARARHHEEFLLSMMKEFKKKGGVKTVTGLMSFAMQYTRTDLSFQQIVALASILDQCDLGSLDYKVINGDYQYIDGICYYLSDKTDVKNRVIALMQ